MKKPTGKNKLIKQLTQHILALPGKKIITLVDETGEFVIDISETGDIGYEETHAMVFMFRLTQALTHGGAVIIRQFLPLKTEKVMPNGKKMWIPKKNIYGVFLGNGQCHPLSKKDVQEAHCTDAQTGMALSKEEDVFFCDFVWKPDNTSPSPT